MTCGYITQNVDNGSSCHSSSSNSSSMSKSKSSSASNTIVVSVCVLRVRGVAGVVKVAPAVRVVCGESCELRE